MKKNYNNWMWFDLRWLQLTCLNLKTSNNSSHCSWVWSRFPKKEFKFELLIFWCCWFFFSFSRFFFVLSCRRSQLFFWMKIMKIESAHHNQNHVYDDNDDFHLVFQVFITFHFFRMFYLLFVTASSEWIDEKTDDDETLDGLLIRTTKTKKKMKNRWPATTSGRSPNLM